VREKKGEGEKMSLGRRRRGEASGVGLSRPDGLKKKRRGNTVRIRKNAP